MEDVGKEKESTFNRGMEMPDWPMLMRDVAPEARERAENELSSYSFFEFSKHFSLKPQPSSKMDGARYRPTRNEE